MYGGRIGFITIGLKPYWVKNVEELEQLKIELDNKLSGLIRSTISNCNQFYQAITLKIFKEEGMEKIIENRSATQNLLRKRFDLLNTEIVELRNKISYWICPVLSFMSLSYCCKFAAGGQVNLAIYK